MYYFRNQWSRSVSGQTLPLRVKQTAVLLVQGDLGQVSKLKVFAPDPAVLKVVEKAGDEPLLPGTRRFEVTALKDADEVDVLAATDATGMNVADGVKFMILTAKESSEYYRNKVVEIARSLEGCHYVNGSAGAMPDMMNGMPSRPDKVYMYKPGCGAQENDIMNSVAYCPQGKFSTCAGRSEIVNPASSYILGRTLTEAELKEETGELSYRTVYLKWERKGIVLGERCAGIRHFDCIGFINYCLSLGLNKKIHWDIDGVPESMYNGYANRSILMTDEENHLPGDILIYDGQLSHPVKVTDHKGRTSMKQVWWKSTHIALSLGKGKGRMHASNTTKGVVFDSDQGKPSRRVRYPNLA